jgi:hypothetical protein
MLFVIYGVHLFTFFSLLSNPNDFLSTASFKEYRSNPDKCCDCLLLLAKQQATKQISAFGPVLNFIPLACNSAILYSGKILPLAKAVIPLSHACGKLYRIFCVFRI